MKVWSRVLNPWGRLAWQIWIGSSKDEASNSGCQTFSNKHWGICLGFKSTKIQWAIMVPLPMTSVGEEVKFQLGLTTGQFISETRRGEMWCFSCESWKDSVEAKEQEVTGSRNKRDCLCLCTQEVLVWLSRPNDYNAWDNALSHPSQHMFKLIWSKLLHLPWNTVCDQQTS